MSILLYGCTTWRWLSVWRKRLMAIIQECYELYWTSPGSNNPQSSSCTATYHLSRKSSKLDEPDMRDPFIWTGKGWSTSNNLPVPIRDVARKTCRKQWMIGMGGERGSGWFVLAARYYDDENSITKTLLTAKCIIVTQQKRLIVAIEW